MKFSFYTDGSCSDNGSKENFGGYGIVLTVNDKPFKLYKHGKTNTTNNEMELMAVLNAIKIAKPLAKKNNQIITIYSDSSYVVNICNLWAHRWKNNGWIKSTDKKPPENLEIIKEIDSLLNFERLVKIKKIKGHDGERFNEMADTLAKQATQDEKIKFLDKRSNNV